MPYLEIIGWINLGRKLTVLAYSPEEYVKLAGSQWPSPSAKPTVPGAQHQRKASSYRVQLGSAHVYPASTMEPQSSAAKNESAFLN
jgi:hypothetical protein